MLEKPFIRQDIKRLLSITSRAIKLKEEYRTAALQKACQSMRAVLFAPDHVEPSLLLPYCLTVSNHLFSASEAGRLVALEETKLFLQNRHRIKPFPLPNLFGVIALEEKNLVLAGVACEAQRAFSYEIAPHIHKKIDDLLEEAKGAYAQKNLETSMRAANEIVTTRFPGMDKDKHDEATALLLRCARQAIKNRVLPAMVLLSLRNIVLGGYDTKASPKAVHLLHRQAIKFLQAGDWFSAYGANTTATSGSSGHYFSSTWEDRLKRTFHEAGNMCLKNGQPRFLMNVLNTMATYWSNRIVVHRALDFANRAREDVRKTLLEYSAFLSSPETRQRETALSLLAGPSTNKNLSGSTEAAFATRQAKTLDAIQLVRNQHAAAMFVARHGGHLPLQTVLVAKNITALCDCIPV